MKKTLIALAILASGASTAAFAAENTWYGFATAGNQSISKSVDGLNSSASQVQLGLGAQLTPMLALEGAWTQGSHAIDGVSNKLDFSGLVMNLKGRYKVNPMFAVTGKVGYSFLSADITGTDFSVNGVHPMFGIGAEYNLTPKAALTVGYDIYKSPADTEVDMDAFTVGIKYKF